MTDNQQEQVEELFGDLCGQKPAAWEAALAGVEDAEVRARVEELLRHSSPMDKGLNTSIQEAMRVASLAGAFEDRSVGPGTRFECYRIERKIGQGGMGDVYEAVRENDFHKRVALKIVRYGLDNEFARGRFQQERQTLAGLEHPFIARLLDGGEAENGCPYLVLEYVDGVPIDIYCAGRPREEVLELFLKVCDAVEYAHRNLIVHRDLKPGNILVTVEGQPKLLDFGIAKLLEPGAEVTQTGFVALSPQFASPEQVRGQTITTASDVYSLGVILYQLLTGRKPYQIESANALEMERIVCQEIPPPPGLGNELDDILMMTLRKEPERRYAGVQAFADDIARYMDGRPVSAAPDTVRYRAGKFVRRHRIGIAAVVALIATLSAGLASTIYQKRRAERQFQDVRSLANTFLFDFHDKIRALPGSTEAREMVVTTALKYLDKLSLEAGDDPGLLGELQAAYTKTGDVQGDISNPSLGHADQAMKSYMRSIEIGEKLHAKRNARVEAIETLGTTYYRVGMLKWSEADSRGAVVSLQKCASIAEELKKRGKTPSTLMIRCYSGLGYAQSAVGDTLGAQSSVEKGLATEEEVMRAKPSVQTQRGMALLRVHLGQILADRGDLAKALKEFEGAADSLAPLLARGEELHRHGIPEAVAFSYVAAGRVSGEPLEPNLGDLAMSLNYYEKAIALREAIVRSDPNDGTALENLADAQIWTGAVLSAMDPVRSIRMYRKSLATIGELTARTSQNHGNDVRLAMVHYGLGRILAIHGEKVAAAVELKEALRLQRTFPADQMTGSEPKRLLARTLVAIGTPPSLQEAVKIAEGLWKEHPQELPPMLMLGDAYEATGDAARKSKNWREASEWYGKSRDLWQSWAQHGVSSTFDSDHARREERLVAECDARDLAKR